MEEIIRAAFFEAAIKGDLATVQRFFTQAGVEECVVKTNRNHFDVRRPLWSEAGLRSRLATGRAATLRLRAGMNALRGPRLASFKFFERIIRYEQFHIPRWFLSASACEIIKDTMVGLVTLLAYHAIRMRLPDVVELLLESYVFTDALLPIERMYALQVLTYQAILFDQPDHPSRDRGWRRRGWILSYLAF